MKAQYFKLNTESLKKYKHLAGVVMISSAMPDTENMIDCTITDNDKIRLNRENRSYELSRALFVGGQQEIPGALGDDYTFTFSYTMPAVNPSQVIKIEPRELYGMQCRFNIFNLVTIAGQPANEYFEQLIDQLIETINQEKTMEAQNAITETAAEPKTYTTIMLPAYLPMLEYKPDLAPETTEYTNIDRQTEIPIDLKIVDFAKNNSGIKCELIGAWIWITGETFKVKDELKALGLKWSRNKSAWYWAGCPSSSRRPIPLSKIRAMHGTTELTEETK